MLQPVLLDSNLLVLLIVGLTSTSYIKPHKKLTEFTEDDFGKLTDVLSAVASEIVSTPNILSETSNLLGHIKEPARTEIYHVFRAFITRTHEMYVASKDASEKNEFIRLGLADAVCLDLSMETVLVITADPALYLAAQKKGGKAVNFWHLLD